MDWLNNPWITTTGGSVISGIFVYWFTQKIFSRKDVKEQNQRLNAANQQIVYAVRAGIPEGRVPSVKVVEALISATARRSGVDVKELYGPSELAADLIKEVMDTNFISAETKELYCEKLLTLREVEPPSLGTAVATRDRISNEKRSQFASALGANLAFVTVGMSIATLVTTRLTTDTLPLLPPALAYLVPASVAVLAALLTALVFKRWRASEIKADQAKIDELSAKMSSVGEDLSKAMAKSRPATADAS